MTQEGNALSLSCVTSCCASSPGSRTSHAGLIPWGFLFAGNEDVSAVLVRCVDFNVLNSVMMYPNMAGNYSTSTL